MKDVDRRILAIALPAFAALVSEPLMLVADTAIVGHLGRSELAGLAAASTVLTTVVGLCIFLAYGSTATVARYQGAGDDRRALESAVGGVWLAGLLGVVLTAVLALIARPLATALSSSAGVADLAHEYLLVATASVPAMLLVLAATGALRGLLDLRTPLIAMIAANLLNIVLTVTFVYGMGAGLAGAALGLVIAQWLAAIWLCAVVVRRARAQRASIHPRLTEILTAATDGVPLLVRTVTLRASLVLATVVAASLGDAPLAAHQIATTVVSLLAFALDALAIAGQTLTGRTLGASDAAGTRAMTRRMMVWGVGAGIAFGAVLAAASPLVARGFTSDETVLATVVPALLVVAAIQPLSGLVFVLDGVLIGAGDGVFLAWAGIVVLAFYAPAALVVGWLGASFTWLWLAYGLFIAARGATLWWRQRGEGWMVLGSAR
ncbi:MATE family efflux transporter [Aeromicrobium phragmitis]|uniref:MATE family efflux transporter n=1 Tax=Aeromicrobium phragmitis TaxID=2478914 RepID=A0A3L8PPG8_9ACTN|nr:MATE family efflux transporter [Aeromicrobium phragmitis]